MKLYTLQECFEQAGNVFPFTVVFITQLYLHNNVIDIKEEITFVSKKHRGSGVLYDLWYPEKCTGSLNFQQIINGKEIINVKTCLHEAFSTESLYSFKKHQFSVDIKKLLD